MWVSRRLVDRSLLLRGEEGREIKSGPKELIVDAQNLDGVKDHEPRRLLQESKGR